MKIVYFDLETCDKDELYTRSDFVRLAAYAVNDGPVYLTRDMQELCGVLASADAVVGHNIVSFDLAALHRWHGLDVASLVNSGRVIDTLVAARQAYPPKAPGSPQGHGLDEMASHLGFVGKLGSGGETALKALAKSHGGYDRIPVDDPTYQQYARQDVEVTRQVAKALPWDTYCQWEAAHLWRLTAVSRTGVRVDLDELARQESMAQQRQNEAVAAMAREYGTPTHGKSPLSTNAGKARIGEVLTALGVEDVALGKNGLPLTSRDVLEGYVEVSADDRLAHFCELVLTANGQRKPPTNYLRSDGRFHPGISAKQRTGRLSVTKPGLTILGKRERRNALDRAVVLPDSDDEVFLCVDLSQVDARAIAAVTQDSAYIDAFAPGKDQHSEMAALIFGDWSRRNDAKVFTHAITYGMGARSLAAKSGLPPSEVSRVLDRLRRAFPQVTNYRENLVQYANGVVVTPLGRRVGYNPRRAYTQGVASVGQATARDLLGMGVMRLPQHLADRLRLIVHDEIVLSVPAQHFEQAREETLRALQFDFWAYEGARPVPILAQASGPGRDWADAYASEHPDWPEMSRAWRLAHRHELTA